MQPPHEGFEFLGPGGGELSVTKADAAVVANAHKGPLASCRAVAPPPDAVAEFDIPQGNRGFPAQPIDLALVHRPREKGQGRTVVKGLLFLVPTLQQIDFHRPGIKIQGVGFAIGEVAKGQPIGSGNQRCPPLAFCPWQGWGNGHQEDQNPRRNGHH